MADHKVYNRQDPDFWNRSRRQETDLDSEDDSTPEWDEEDHSGGFDAARDDADADGTADEDGDEDIEEQLEDDGLELTSDLADGLENTSSWNTGKVNTGSRQQSGREKNRDNREDERHPSDLRRRYDREERTFDTAALPAVRAGSDEKGTKPAGNPHFRQQVLQLILVIAAVAAVILLIIYQSRTRTFDAATYQTVASLSGQEDTSYLPIGNNILAYSRDGASCLGSNGTQIWNITYEMQQPLVSSSGDVVTIGDYNGSTIYIVSDSEVLGTVDTSMPIRGLSVSSSGEVAAVLNDTDVTWIYLYDSQGNTIAYFKTTMGQSGYPLGVAVSPDGKMVAVSHLTMGTTAVSTSIAFYNFGSVGQTVTENNVAGYNYDDEVFPFISYMNNSTCAAVSDQRLVFFNGSDVPAAGANAMFDSQAQGVFANSEYICILFPDTTGQEQYTMRVYNAGGSLVSSIPFTMDYTDIQLCGDRIVISNDQAIMIYTTDGTLKYQGSFPESVRAVIPMSSSSNRLTIITAAAMKQMVLE